MTFDTSHGGELVIADFFHTLDVVLKIGTTAANALIGSVEHSGFVYTLKATGGSGSFAFMSFKRMGPA